MAKYLINYSILGLACLPAWPSGLLEVKYDVGYGNALYITGDQPNLGLWKTAFRLHNVNEDTWQQIDIKLKPGSYFKLLVAPYNKGERIQSDQGKWEVGDAHIATDGDLLIIPRFEYADLPPWEPKDPLNLHNIVKSSKIIKLNIEPPYYNASIIEENPSSSRQIPGFLMVFRYDKNPGSPLQTAHMGAVRLTAQFEQDSPIFPLETQTNTNKSHSQTEDPRIFKLKDRYYLVYNDSETYKFNGRRNMFVAELHVSKDGIYLGHPVKLSYPARDFHPPLDKNWTPVVHNDNLYLIYSFSPLIVLRADLKSGHCHEVTKSLRHFAWTSKFGEMRGGTPAVQMGDADYITFFHSSGHFPEHKNQEKKHRNYLMGALTFSIDPLSDKFAIKRITEVPIVSTDFYGPDNPSGIVFVMGLIIREKDVLISYGIGDKKIGVSILDKDQLLKALKSDAQVRIIRSDSSGQINDGEIYEAEFEPTFEVGISQMKGKPDQDFLSIKSPSQGKALLNLFIEHVYDVNATRHATNNWLMINQEYVDAPEILSSIDVVLCKSELAVRLMKEYRKKYNLKFKIYLTKFTTNINFAQEASKNYDLAIHLAGKSPTKNTDTVLTTWLKNRAFPKLIATCRTTPQDALWGYGCLPMKAKPILDKFGITMDSFIKNDNLELYTSFVDQNKLNHWQETAGYYIVPSSVEGYGHYINEGRAAGAVIITTNAAPMNELVRDGESGLLVPIKASKTFNQYSGAQEYTIDENELTKTVEKALNLSEEEKYIMGQRARQAFNEDTKFFKSRMKILIDSLKNHGDLSDVPHELFQ